jgi:hypothetical protein
VYLGAPYAFFYKSSSYLSKKKIVGGTFSTDQSEISDHIVQLYNNMYFKQFS